MSFILTITKQVRLLEHVPDMNGPLRLWENKLYNKAGKVVHVRWSGPTHTEPRS